MKYSLEQIGHMVKLLHREAPYVSREQIAIKLLQQQGYTEPLTIRDCGAVLGKSFQAVSLNEIKALNTIRKVLTKGDN